MANFQKWTPEQIIFLYRNYTIYGDTELSEMFNALWNKPYGWTKKHIEKKRKHMGMKRTKEQIQSIVKRNGVQGRYNWMKAWETRGAAKNGTIKAWGGEKGYRLFIKLKDGYTPYAHWLYEQIFGAIPENMVVRLKDGNHFNVSVDNMTLITRAEHGTLNSKSRGMPIEIKEAAQMNNNLKKIIYEQEHN